MNELTFRKATEADIPAIMKIIAAGRKYMRSHGNNSQWPDWYPNPDVIKGHLAVDAMYVGVDEKDTPAFCFALRFGADPTYAVIEGGSWLNDEPYATIHTVASDGRFHGCLQQCLEFCKNKCKNLRADTHENNQIVNQILQDSGFVKCGIIYVMDGTPRIAYQLNI